ncbi:hypothetical protein [Formosa sp. PL04]|uniref:hypothetical protein n=1 Tax=Formosa sp. PL04 TaxID=3081755 RepID=UPI0029829796|nr:hypothetical protein [Formosa sp. PL04]MDW5288857.1 hypothetical protein [Formosa sp. PL04]
MDITSYTLLTLLTFETLLTILSYGILIRTALSFSPNYDLTIMKWVNDRNYNSHVIFLKLCVSIFLVSCPILFYKTYTSFSFQNESLNIVFLLALITLTCYLIYFNKNKVWSDKNNLNVKGWIPVSKRIDKNNEKIEDCIKKQHLDNSELDTYKRNTSKSITDLNQTCIKREKIEVKHELAIKNLDTNQNYTDKRVSVLEIARTKTNKTVLKHELSIKSLDTNQNYTHKNITDLKISFDKSQSKNKRVSSDKEEKCIKIENEFNKLLEDLETSSEYNSKNKTLNYKGNDLTELQAYQTLVIFFKDNYDVPKEKFNNVIFKIFNSHFSIKNTQLQSSNWSDFRNRLLPDIENNTFYSNLCLIK